MITSNYSISVNLYWRKTYIFVIKIKTLSYSFAVIAVLAIEQVEANAANKAKHTGE
ncbi:hypothetical protein [Arsenophonus endosymbiont of Bemisia tabaci]|uniref:hypothetical protein n=1 Tax=Arsenophonus endosymbiont of Bemisia tabaci TaxID=536059 RepID=UPI0015F36715|nr:hypothetical protein [Arsenophonus endosymbiont of Bemisia tabaci]